MQVGGPKHLAQVFVRAPALANPGKGEASDQVSLRLQIIFDLEQKLLTFGTLAVAPLATAICESPNGLLVKRITGLVVLCNKIGGWSAVTLLMELYRRVDDDQNRSYIAGALYDLKNLGAREVLTLLTDPLLTTSAESRLTLVHAILGLLE